MKRSTSRRTSTNGAVSVVRRMALLSISTGMAALTACGGPAAGSASGGAASPSSPSAVSQAAVSATSSLDPGQLDIEAFLRTDPEIVRRFGATPHGGRLACAFTTILPRSEGHLYARFLCLEVIGTGPGAFSTSGSASTIAMNIDPKTGAVGSWRIPRDGTGGGQDLQEMFPPDVLTAFRSADADAVNLLTAQMQRRCLAIANELGAPS